MIELIRAKLRTIAENFGAWAHDTEIAQYGSTTYLDGKIVAETPTITYGELRAQREFNARYLPSDASPPF